jgi:hypothetical protein
MSIVITLFYHHFKPIQHESSKIIPPSRRCFAPGNPLFFSFLFFSFLFFKPITASAQECNDFGLEFCRVMTPGAIQGSCTSPEPDCFRFYYEVFLVPASGAPTYFEPSEWSIEANVTMEGTGAVLSSINDATIDCVSGFFGAYDPTVSIDAESRNAIFSLNLPPQSPAYSFYVGGQPRHLFTIIVDAFPGETIDLEMASHFVIDEEPCNMALFFCPNSQTSIEVTMPEPAACASPCTSQSQEIYLEENNQDVLVVLDAGAANFAELDFAIDITTTNAMLTPTITGIVNGLTVELIPDGQGFRLYAHGKNVSVSGATTLFTIELNGPSLPSASSSNTLTLVNGRIKTSSQCCKPCLGSPVQIDFSGYSACTDFKFIVSKDRYYNTSDCKAALLVTIDWNDNAATINFNRLLIRFKTHFSNNASIVGLGSNDWGCPSGSSQVCGSSNCYTLTGTDVVQYCLGSVSPITITKGTGFQLIIEPGDGCVEDITFLDAYIQVAGVGFCVPAVEETVSSSPVCGSKLSGMLRKIDNTPLLGAYTINIEEDNGNGACNVAIDYACTSSGYSHCVCNVNSEYKITPENDTHPLNGVTTFDLVLISKHILMTQFLDSPYKIIAADANKSNSVTSFDLVEIRKLILLINTTFPSNKSWRFIDASFTFLNPQNPFTSIPFPESQITPAPGNVDWIAIKVGDVNNNAQCVDFLSGSSIENRVSPEPYDFVTLVKNNVKAGEFITLPVVANGNNEIIAFQAGIRFDPEKLAFTGPSKGALNGYSKDNFGLTDLQKGYIRTLWHTMDDEFQGFTKGKTLFYLTFKALTDIPDFNSLIQLDDAVLTNYAYDPDGLAYPLTLRAGAVTPPPVPNPLVRATCLPNPFSDEMTFEVTTAEPCKGSVWVFDAFGKRLSYKEVQFERGVNRLTDAVVPNLPTGVLNWRVETPFGGINGIAVKQ